MNLKIYPQLKLQLLVGFTALLSTIHVWAIEEVGYQDWAVQLGADTSEAYVRNKDNSSLGFFCKDEKCVYYLNLNLACPPGAKNPILINSDTVTAASMVTCSHLGGRSFQIFDDPEVINKAVKVGNQIGFSTALQGGTFLVTQFSLNDSQRAVERAVLEAKQKKRPQSFEAAKGVI